MVLRCSANVTAQKKPKSSMEDLRVAAVPAARPSIKGKVYFPSLRRASSREDCSYWWNDKPSGFVLKGLCVSSHLSLGRQALGTHGHAGVSNQTVPWVLGFKKMEAAATKADLK